MLDLEPCVDLHERERLARRVVEELDGAGVVVPCRAAERGCTLLEPAIDLGIEHRRGRLLEDLLIPPLERAVADAEGPDRAVAVTDDLHLHMSRLGDHRLEEDGVVAEELERLGAGGPKHFCQLGVGSDLANSPSAAARGRLEHQRVAELLGVSLRLVLGLDRPGAPGRHRDAGLLGQ